MMGPEGEHRHPIGPVFLVGLPADWRATYMAALRRAGLDPVHVEDETLLIALRGRPLIVTMLADTGQCGTLGVLHRANPGAVIVAVVTVASDRTVRLAINCGAQAVISLADSPEVAAEKILQASSGYSAMIASAFNTRRGLELSDTDVKWLSALADAGRTMDGVARGLGWSRSEFQRLVRPLYRKLGVRGRAEAVAKAREWGVI